MDVAASPLFTAGSSTAAISLNIIYIITHTLPELCTHVSCYNRSIKPI